MLPIGGRSAPKIHQKTELLYLNNDKNINKTSTTVYIYYFLAMRSRIVTTKIQQHGRVDTLNRLITHIQVNKSRKNERMKEWNNAKYDWEEKEEEEEAGEKE